MRAIWSGSISFGLINIPVALLSASTSDGLNFDLIHKSDYCPINYARVCRSTGKEIPYSEIARAYQYKKGKYVIVEDEDFEKANVKKYRSVQILNFVPTEEIDRIYFEKPYYLKPDDSSDRAYFLFNKTLRESKKSALGKFILRNREHLCLIEPRGKYLMLYQLRFAQEIKEPDFEIEQVELTQKEEALAISLVNSLSQEFDLKIYRDTYTDELKNLIEQKARGEEIKVPEPISKVQIPDLMKALEESLKVQKQK